MLSAIFRNHRFPALEISIVILLILAAEWIAPYFFGKSWVAGAIPAFLALLFILLNQISRGGSPRDLGWRVDNFGRAILLLTPLMAAASLVLVTIGWYFGTLNRIDAPAGLPLLWTSLALVAWGLIQQYPLQSFINQRLQEIFGPGTTSILFVAVVFALLHLPNFWLMTATFFGGLLWSYAYQREPNLWALALSHAIMTAVLVMTVQYSSLHGLRVGYNYFIN